MHTTNMQADLCVYLCERWDVEVDIVTAGPGKRDEQLLCCTRLNVTRADGHLAL